MISLEKVDGMTCKRKQEALSLRAYAIRRKAAGLPGGSAEAVSKAIAERRLKKSVVRVNGQPKIADAELADREWEANTQPRADLSPRRRQRAQAEAEGEEDVAVADAPNYWVSRALREAAAARREAALADLAELDVRQRRGELVEASEVESHFVDVVTAAKTRLLGVASRAKAELPHIATEDIDAIENLIREALEELASEDEASDIEAG